MNDGPYPTDDNEREDELEQSEKEGVGIEIISSTGWNHGADTRGKRNAIEDEADDGESVLERDDCFFASSASLVNFLWHTFYCKIINEFY